MLLPEHELHIFFKLHQSLMFFVNKRLKVVPNEATSPIEYARLSPELRFSVHEAFVSNLELCESFADENSFGFSQSDLEIVRSWKHLVTGKFFILRELKEQTIFLSATPPSIAYSVAALSHPITELVGTNLPKLVQTTLLPFKGMIVYDGLLYPYQLPKMPGLRQSLNESLKEAKDRIGIVTSLPMLNEPLPPKALKTPKTKPVQKPRSKVEEGDSLGVIIELINQFCKEHLNEEYAVLCRELAEKLSRKRPSPLLQGSPNAWASGIVRAIGGVNFLHDKTQTPYMRATDIDQHLGTSASSGAAKSAAIRKMFKMYPFDPKWCLPSLMDDNPAVWMFQIDGFMVDIRSASRDLQEQAFKQGLIPYIPADN